MDTPPKTFGSVMRQVFEAVTRRPMGWKMIDAFARLEEREEELRARDSQRPAKPAKPDERS